MTTGIETEDLLHRAIKLAKLGGSRRDAQVDTCGVFAAALHDALKACGIPSTLWSVAKLDFARQPEWYHALVEVNGKHYDSLGLFSDDILRARLKWHPKVSLDLSYKTDNYETCLDEELAGLHEFYLKALKKSLVKEGVTLDRLSETADVVIEDAVPVPC